MPVLEYLDVRGFRECALHYRLSRIVQKMQVLDYMQLTDMYTAASAEASCVEDVVKAVCSAVCQLHHRVKAREDRFSGQSLGTMLDSDDMSTRSSRVVLRWNSKTRLLSSLSDFDREGQIAIDDLDGRPLWAKFGKTPIWPARLVPATEAPDNIRRLRPTAEGSECSTDDDADASRCHCLVQFYHTDEYAWVEHSKIFDFWPNYTEHANQLV